LANFGGIIAKAILAGLLMKKLPFVVGGIIGQSLSQIYYYSSFVFVYGYAHELALFIVIKGIINQGINLAFASIILAIPGLANYLPATYDSVAAREFIAEESE
ncbi:MAG: hypothetical protein ACXACA_02400, partial [Candidatus Ranarchaeia archaeon]